MNKLDKKFDGVIFKIKDGTIVPPDQYIVFLAKDNALPATLEFYHSQCQQLGADERQLAAIQVLIQYVKVWRATHQDQCKVPDIGPQEELLT